MGEFWESNFSDKKEIWGLEPSKSAFLANDLFIQKSFKNILVPGFGYGRNAQIFKEHKMNVTGIEISKTAIELARKHYNEETTIYHGSVTNMPFDQLQYNGIFCYALIHLLNSNERQKLISDCYNQLDEGGMMIFTAISKSAPNFGKGKMVGKDQYEIHEGAPIFFYDKESVKSEFGNYGFTEAFEIDENQPMYFIKCKRNKQ